MPPPPPPPLPLTPSRSSRRPRFRVLRVAVVIVPAMVLRRRPSKLTSSRARHILVAGRRCQGTAEQRPGDGWQWGTAVVGSSCVSVACLYKRCVTYRAPPPSRPSNSFHNTLVKPDPFRPTLLGWLREICPVASSIHPFHVTPDRPFSHDRLLFDDTTRRRYAKHPYIYNLYVVVVVIIVIV